MRKRLLLLLIVVFTGTLFSYSQEPKIILTPNEQYTQVSLWSMVAAPLIFSGDIT
jgi:hypothetical protein